jgi:hypothetical protein
MIKIKKPSTGPEVRNRKAQNKLKLLRDEIEALYDADPISYDTGAKKFDFDNEVYGHSKIKRGLIKAQKGKCAFCESNIISIASGDVEHFRPKGGYKQNEKQVDLSKPGYYWLAYEWDNFFLSCERCNRIFKKNLYPLLKPNTRCKNHRGTILSERAYLVLKR